MVNGFNPACVVIMPMLGRKQEEYPRFRDCFVTEEDNIAILTRVGGNNRNCGYGEKKLYEDENFLNTYDEDFDSTYGVYVFKVPDRWKEDFDRIMCGKMSEVSNEYVEYVKEFYPKLAERGLIDKIFGREE